MDQNSEKTRTPSTIAPAGGEARAERPVEHGGRLRAAMARFPDAPRPFIDLSTGINPAPYPVPALDGETFARLPEPEELAALQEAAARAYGVADPSMVVAAPGTQILIDLLPRLAPAGSVAVLAPTYGEHAPAWARAGHDVRPIEDIAGLAACATAVLCNPNNPDGRRHAPDQLIELAATLAARDGRLIVDEAFAEFAESGLSVAGRLPRDGLVVLRSFGKAYGLAGLRLGFALASTDVAATIREALGPWAVSGPAIAVATAALGDEAWREGSGRRLAADTERLDALLVEAGFEIVGGTSLFRLAAGDHATETWRRLAGAGILVRAFEDRPDWLRFGLPGDEGAWRRLEPALSRHD